MPGEGNTGIGVGLVVLQYNRGIPTIIHQNMTNLGHSQLVYNGELEGTTQAIEYASRTAQPGQTYHIYSDNQAGLFRLRTPSDHPGQACQIRAIQAAERAQSKGATVSVNWVPGHTEVYGNELADALAKQATRIAPSTHHTSFAVLGCKVRELNATEWQAMLDQPSRQQNQQNQQNQNQNPNSYRNQFPWRLWTKIQLPPGTKRILASSFYQLKLGHGYIKAYLHRIGRAGNNRCRCGKKETAEHLLLSCRDTQLVTVRTKLKDKIQELRPSLRLLMHTKIGIEKTLDFLRDTRICTRRWHLERWQEEQAEQER
jgi:ribonuclease HI